jgi:ribosome-associated translation inhibitor RaiA
MMLQRTDSLTHGAIRPNVWMLTNHEPNEETMTYLTQWLESERQKHAMQWHLHYIRAVLKTEETHPNPQVTLDLIQERIEEAFRQWDQK